MEDPRSTDYEPPAPDQTLQAWLASSATDWAVSQPTLWLPAVPAEPPPAPSRPSIPEQRGPGRRRAARSTSRRLRAVEPGAPPAPPETGPPPADSDTGHPGPPARAPGTVPGPGPSAPRSRSRTARALFTAAMLLLAVLVVGLALSSATWQR